eukprot:TRINITY_DN10643_c0_g1_i1.p1 TRINITY_DN10643_c0_g1~~TRINITY_DN10643_c0_g1_i1.p1  ORF type:complete len:369 (+),score=86.08 TRINITY_DN10643_c0_g1_i1:26-1108(+)
MAARLAAFRVAPSPLPSKTALHFPLPCGVEFAACKRCPRQFTRDGCPTGWHVQCPPKPRVRDAKPPHAWRPLHVYTALYQYLMHASDFGKVYCEPIRFGRRMTPLLQATFMLSLLTHLRSPHAIVPRHDVQAPPHAEPLHHAAFLTALPRHRPSDPPTPVDLVLPDEPLLWLISNIPLREVLRQLGQKGSLSLNGMRATKASLVHPEGKNWATVTLANSPLPNPFPGSRCRDLAPVLSDDIPDGFDNHCRPMLNDLALERILDPTNVAPTRKQAIARGVGFLDAIGTRLVIDPALPGSTPRVPRSHRLAGGEALDWLTGPPSPTDPEGPAYWACLRHHTPTWTGQRPDAFLRHLLHGAAL